MKSMKQATENSERQKTDGRLSRDTEDTKNDTLTRFKETVERSKERGNDNRSKLGTSE